MEEDDMSQESGLCSRMMADLESVSPGLSELSVTERRYIRKGSRIKSQDSSSVSKSQV